MKLSGRLITREALTVGLVLALVVISSLLVAFAVSPNLTRYVYGDFTYGCPVLQSKLAYNDSIVRWITLSCPGGPALGLIPSGEVCGYREPTCTRIYPSFTPPQGLLGLYLYNHGTSGCPFTQSGNPTGMTPIQTRVDLVYYHIDSPTYLDYCAVVKRSTDTIDGFTVIWTAGVGGAGSNNKITASVTNATIRIGNSASLTLRVMNQYGFDVTLNFAKGMTWLTPNYNYTFAGMTFNPPTVIVKAGNSNSTTVTVTTSPSQVLGNYEVELDANPIYGLRFYGDCGATPSYGATGAIAYLRLTY